MKAIQKIIIIVGIVTFFSAQAMEQGYYVEKADLSCVNPTLDMKKISIYSQIKHGTVSKRDNVYDDKGVAFLLSALKFLDEDSEIKSKEILETMRTKHIPRSTNYIVKLSHREIDILISSAQQPIPLEQALCNLCRTKLSVDNDKQKSLYEMMEQSH